MPLFLLSRALLSPDGFWSTCTWTAPESLSKRLIHHISSMNNKENRFTAELRNLGDSLRWTAGLPEELRSQVVIVVVGENMRRVLNREDILYTPDQRHARNEIKRIYKACNKSIAIKHISDIEPEHLAGNQGSDTQDGQLKLDVPACNALLKSIMGPDNIWMTADNGLSISERRTISNVLCAQTSQVLDKYTPKSGKKSDAGVARMKAAVQEYLDGRENYGFATPAARISGYLPKSSPKPYVHSQATPPLSTSESHLGRKMPHRPRASLAPKNSEGSVFLDSLFAKHIRPESPRPACSRPGLKRKAEEEPEEQPVRKQRWSVSSEFASVSGAGTSSSSATDGSPKCVSRASSGRPRGRTSDVDVRSRIPKVLAEERALKRLGEESAKRSQQTTASPSPAPSSHKRKADDEIDEGASPSKRGRFEGPGKRPSVKLVGRK